MPAKPSRERDCKISTKPGRPSLANGYKGISKVLVCFQPDELSAKKFLQKCSGSKKETILTSLHISKHDIRNDQSLFCLMGSSIPERHRVGLQSGRKVHRLLNRPVSTNANQTKCSKEGTRTTSHITGCQLPRLAKWLKQTWNPQSTRHRSKRCPFKRGMWVIGLLGYPSLSFQVTTTVKSPRV